MHSHMNPSMRKWNEDHLMPYIHPNQIQHGTTPNMRCFVIPQNKKSFEGVLVDEN